VKCILKKMNRDYKTILRMEPDVGIGNGGLGRLASCLMDSLAMLQYPALGYGMRYQYGIFEQDLWCGVQVERPDNWLLTQNPWEFRRDCHAQNVHFEGTIIPKTNSHGDEVYDIADYDEVRALPYDFPILGYGANKNFSVLTLRLWSTKESPRNFHLQKFNAGQIDEAGENTLLTDVLYPNDNHEIGKRIRLKQEFLLVSASLQDIVQNYLGASKDITGIADKVRIQINDTHPALVVAELMRTLTKDHEIAWGKALEITRECCSYTNHTILKEALEEWNEHRIEKLLPSQYKVLQRLNGDLCQEIRKRFPNDESKLRRMSIIEGGQIKMAHLSIFGSHRVNGVAKLHSEILKDSIFKDFYEMYPERFVNVTNGVTQRRWLLFANPKLCAFLEKRIGNGWITDFSKIKGIASYASDKESQEEFLAIKKENKQALLDFLCKDMKEKHWGGKDLKAVCFCDSDALFDVQVKRVHEYKRQLMNALHVIMRFQEIKENPDANYVKRFVLIGGKAAPGYTLAKNIIRLFYCLGRAINQDPIASKFIKVHYIENYNVSKAEIIIPATDLSEQISTAGMEASGTGNMKFAMNGALTIGTDDGANVEMREEVTDKYWPFLFGSSASTNIKIHHEKSYNPRDIYDKNPKIKKAVDALQDRTFVENDAEHEALYSLYQTLLENHGFADRYFVLKDLDDYYNTQKKVDALYQTPNKWAEYAIQNMAGMGNFSTDHSITNYAETIWNVKPLPPSEEELEAVRQEYLENDRCRII
ncbi:MAG: glycogen/starch/alpha-glucan family phosphorylase, partial [Simkaniaceae bacterium]|nr:glycogen/starch/alpha-glucan family phosphorylase [Simkaniaceae bacterium]